MPTPIRHTPFHVDTKRSGGNSLIRVYPNPSQPAPNASDYTRLQNWLHADRCVSSTLWTQATLDSTARSVVINKQTQRFTLLVEGQGVLGGVHLAIANMTFGSRGSDNETIAHLLAQFAFGTQRTLLKALSGLGPRAVFTTSPTGIAA